MSRARGRARPVALLWSAALGALACAYSVPPPGAPVDDKSPPALLRTSVDSGAVGVRPRGAVGFQFDEVVSERPQGVSSLNQLVLISPRDGAPRVNWHRSRVDVRPRRDWRANTAYTITLLPGISDLQNNARKEPLTLLFSTGPTIPKTRAAGVVFDWVQGTPAARAVIEAIARDSTTYVAVADSSGRFAIAHVAPGAYTLRGYVDANGNRALDPREAWDTVAVTVADSARTDLYVFVHDSVGPRIATVDVRDSVTLRVTLDRAVDPRQTLDTTLFSLRAADSSAVPVRAVRAAREYERARAQAEGERDTTGRAGQPPRPRRPPPDSAAAPPAPTPQRPLPVSEVILEVFPPLRAGTSYRVEARQLRGLLGNLATSQRVFSTPAAPRAAPGRAPVPSDTTRRPPR